MGIFTRIRSFIGLESTTELDDRGPEKVERVPSLQERAARATSGSNGASRSRGYSRTPLKPNAPVVMQEYVAIDPKQATEALTGNADHGFADYGQDGSTQSATVSKEMQELFNRHRQSVAETTKITAAIPARTSEALNASFEGNRQDHFDDTIKPTVAVQLEAQVKQYAPQLGNAQDGAKTQPEKMASDNPVQKAGARHGSIVEDPKSTARRLR